MDQKFMMGFGIGVGTGSLLTLATLFTLKKVKEHKASKKVEDNKPQQLPANQPQPESQKSQETEKQPAEQPKPEVASIISTKKSSLDWVDLFI